MKAVRCPYLGLRDDPATALDFPSSGNACHKTASPVPIKLHYQQTTCLTGQHTGCPVYTARPRPAAKPVQARPLPAGPSQGRLAFLLLPLVILALAGTVYAWNAGWFARVAGWAAQDVPQAESQQEAGFHLFEFLPQKPTEEAPQPLILPNTSNQQAQTACPAPQNWVQYTVKPTDSLFRLSVIHRVTVEVLRKANCLDSQAALTPGQVISVPASATATLPPAAAPWPTFPGWTFTPAPVQNLPAPVSTPVPVEPTDEPPAFPPPAEVPATAVPSTALPPTQVPPTAVPPTEAPPTEAPSPTQTPTDLPPAPTNVPPTATDAPPTATDLPPTPVPPTATLAPTPVPPTSAPAADIVKESGKNLTINCGGGSVTVQGSANTITLTGECSGLTVNGNNNTITVPAGTPVRDSGNKNVIIEQ